jgi:hypothetical protein
MSTPGLQPEIVPSRESNRKMLAPDLPFFVTIKPEVLL